MLKAIVVTKKGAYGIQGETEQQLKQQVNIINKMEIVDEFMELIKMIEEVIKPKNECDDCNLNPICGNEKKMN